MSDPEKAQLANSTDDHLLHTAAPILLGEPLRTSSHTSTLAPTKGDQLDIKTDDSSAPHESKEPHSPIEDAAVEQTNTVDESLILTGMKLVLVL